MSGDQAFFFESLKCLPAAAGRMDSLHANNEDVNKKASVVWKEVAKQGSRGLFVNWGNDLAWERTISIKLSIMEYGHICSE